MLLLALDDLRRIFKQEREIWANIALDCVVVATKVDIASILQPPRCTLAH